LLKRPPGKFLKGPELKKGGAKIPPTPKYFKLFHYDIIKI